MNVDVREKFSQSDEQTMQLALQLAQRAWQAGEVPVGAVLVDAQGEIIGQGYNQVITQADPTWHAEIEALRQAAQQQQNYRLPGAQLFVTLEPCMMCLGACCMHALRGLCMPQPILKPVCVAASFACMSILL